MVMLMKQFVESERKKYIHRQAKTTQLNPEHNIVVIDTWCNGSHRVHFVQTLSPTKRAPRFVNQAQVTRLHKICSMLCFVIFVHNE
jgi:hypothetical protein